jgi:hypothetical protein
MKFRILIAALLLVCFAAPLAIAQSGADIAAEPRVPRQPFTNQVFAPQSRK